MTKQQAKHIKNTMNDRPFKMQCFDCFYSYAAI